MDTAMTTTTETPAAVRIVINTANKPHPVIFNYRQLYKRELKKLQESNALTASTTIAPLSTSESADDVYFQDMLKRAEAYAMDGDDVDQDNESDEEVKTKKQVGNDYDFEDPFIDDSEMLLDEPQEYSAPEFDGFFVYHGPLDGSSEGNEKSKASSKRKTTTKSKGSASTSTAPSSSSKRAASTIDKSRTSASIKKTTNEEPTTATPITKPTTTVKKPSTATNTTTAVPAPAAKKSTSNTDQPAKKRKKLDTKENSPAQSSVVTDDAHTDKKKKPTPSTPSDPSELKPLDPEIEVLMEKLRKDVVHEDFSNKAKFPPALKPTVLEAGLVMLRKMRTIDENLVHHLMAILPYNRFTLKKFLTTKSGQMRVDELQQEIDELAIQLKQTIDKMMPEQQRVFNDRLSQTPSTETEEIMPKFKCNDDVRKILYDIIQTEEHSISIANQVAIHKDGEKKKEELASDNKARRMMYQRLLSCWPEGWMNTYEMSRQYSQYKSKLASLNEKNKVAMVEKKRKRVTPQQSPSDERLKKPSAADQGIVPPDSQLFAQKLNAAAQTPPPVITIDDDEEEQVPVRSNSMAIEALISNRPSV